jgi:hypothetical protein
MLKTGDWLCMEHLGRFWDMAQNYYNGLLYSDDLVDRLVDKRTELAEKVKAGQKGQDKDVGGFSGEADWPLIKRIHNQKVVDDALTRQVFNVMATSAAKDLTFRDEQSAVKSQMMKEFLAIFAPVGAKPEGEKHNIYRFDTIAYCTQKSNTIASGALEFTYWTRILRDRGRQETRLNLLETTDRGFWGAYTDLVGKK